MDLDIPFTRFALANGLNVLVHEDRSLPVVGVNVWYHVGSKNEKPGRTGFAHLFEHIMFEGSANVPEGDFDHLLESVGGVNNGSTNPDRTNYWENIPSNAVELALWLEADRMGWLLETMDQRKLDVQRDVVMNERRQSYENRPYGLAMESLAHAMYPAGHPYRWPTIGSMDDLAAATLDDVVGFFRTYYAPDNASLAVAGDVSADEVRRLVERLFGEIPRGPGKPPIHAPDVRLTGRTSLTMEDDVPLPRLYVGWHTPAAFTDADAAMDVAASILADGKSSRLYRRLVYEEQVAQDVSAYQLSQELCSRFMVVVTAKPDGALAPLEAAVREEIGALAEAVPSDEEMERSINQIETGFVDSLERVGGFGGKADQLNRYHVYTGDAGYLRRDLARFQRTGPGDVSAALRRHVTDGGSVVLSVVPRGRRDLAAADGP